MINFDEPNVCPDCGSTRFRTITVIRNGKNQWLRGCNDCEFETVIGDV